MSSPRAQENPPERSASIRSTRSSLAAIVLGFESVIVVLIGLTLFGLNVFEPREIGLIGGAALAVLALLGAALARTPIGLGLGWVVQGLILATAILLPALLIPGGLFAALWVYCFIVGGRIDRERQARQSLGGESTI